MRAKTGKRDRTSRRASLRKTVASVTPRRTGSKTRSASQAPTRPTAKRIDGGKKYALAPRNVVVGTLCVVAAAALVMIGAVFLLARAASPSPLAPWLAAAGLAANPRFFMFAGDAPGLFPRGRRT